MAITTYSELQTAIANWLDRDDLTDRIPEFIALAEARFIRKIKHWRMEGRATANTVASTRTMALPSDYYSMRNLKLNNGSYTDVLEYMSPSVLYEGSSTTGGTPKYYTIQGNQIALEPIPDTAYEIEIDYISFDVLSDSNTTNWLLTNYPDIYLLGSLVMGEAFMVNDERVPGIKAALDEAMKELDRDDKAGRWNGTPLTIRVEA